MSNDERDLKKDRAPVDLRDLAEDELVERTGGGSRLSERAERARTPSIQMTGREVPLASKSGGPGSRLGNVFGQPLDPVTYELRVRGGPDPGWHVRRMHFVESISEPYELVVDVLTDDIDLETDELLGADAELEYTRNTFARVVPGVIEQVDFLGVASDRLQVRLHIVPAFKLLQLQVDTRIFQDKSVPEILQEVLEPSLGQYGRKLDRSKLGTDYLVRDYCVQYGESDFAFASRLMEEEGIAYMFEPESEEEDGGSVERLVLLDQTEGKPNSDFPEIDGDTRDQIPIITDRPETADCESLRYLDWYRPEQVTKLTTRRFNWKRPDPQALPSAEQKRLDTRGRTREVYVPDPRRRIEDYQKRDAYRGTKAGYDEDPLTVKRFQGATGGQAQGHGASNVTCLRAGGVFEIAEHPHGGVSFTRLLVTRAIHSGECPDREMGAEADGARFQNTFECIPEMTPFRKQETTPKPRVFGPQTATVTGPEGEEIHTDVHGRIKVFFHWDRLSPLDDRSSCWVRVAQMWAGPGWGTWFLPRIGMEVVVEFLDGNPDRPLVVGCVYNGRNGTPYPLPEEKTKSTIKSNSSVEGEGFNEIRFEDAKGAEEIFIHAQRDQNERVLNNRTRTVKGNEQIVIEGNKLVHINGRPSHGDAQGIAQGRETHIDGHEILRTTKTVYICAPERIAFEVPGSSIVLEPGSITLTAGNGAFLRLDEDALVSSKACSTLELSGDIIASTDAQATINASMVTVLGETSTQIQGAGVFLNCIGAGVPVKGSGSVFVGDTHEPLQLQTDAEFDEQIRVVRPEGQPISHVPYKITLANGVVATGTTNEDGKTQRVRTRNPILITVLELMPANSAHACVGRNLGLPVRRIPLARVATNNRNIGTSFCDVPVVESFRLLTDGERKMCSAIFADSIDYDEVKVHNGPWLPGQGDAAVAPYGEIFFPEKSFQDDYSSKGVTLADKRWFMHEMTHVWQYQLGYSVMLRGVLVQAYDKVGGDAYSYSASRSAKFCDYGMEQQAEIIGDYFMILNDPGYHPKRGADADSQAFKETLSMILSDFLKNPKDANNLPQVTIAR